MNSLHNLAFAMLAIGGICAVLSPLGIIVNCIGLGVEITGFGMMVACDLGYL